jgi:hypothetical protein
MKRALVLAFLFAIAATAARGTEVVRVAPWDLHSSFWMSLHQTLMHDATRRDPRDVAALTAEEQTAWNEAFTAYRTAAAGAPNITFTRPMVITIDGLSQVADDAISPTIDAPMSDALTKAAPVYRKHWWRADDAANRFFIAYAAALLREAGAELIRAHSAAYRMPWPDRVRVYITPHAGPFGAYTITNLRNAGITTTMSSRDSGYQGFRALEMMLHESSHALVDPNHGTVAAAIHAATKKLGVKYPVDLWHAILFATSSELTRRALAERGTTQYAPYANDMFRDVWPRYREPIEQHWIPYLSGNGTLEEAVEKVVAAIPR